MKADNSFLNDNIYYQPLRNFCPNISCSINKYLPFAVSHRYDALCFMTVCC